MDANAQGTSQARYAEDQPQTQSKEAFSNVALRPSGSNQQIQKKTSMLQPNVSPAGSIKVEWPNDNPIQQVC